MPKGPNGQKRPADVIGNAVHIMRIATGETEEQTLSAKASAGALGGMVGGKARAAAMTPKERTDAAKKAAKARWKKPGV